MNIALVKVDVAALIMRKSPRALFELAEGATLIERGLQWVFDFSNGTLRSATDKSHRRDLRFWEPELQVRGSGDISKHDKYLWWEIDWVIKKILPEKRVNFQAGEIDQLFQIRHNTRLELFESAGLTSGRNFYSRTELAEFLKQRWLGAKQFPAKSPPASPRATAPTQIPTKNPILHAGQLLQQK